MALLTFSNEGAPAHFFHLIEASMMRLQNVKMLLCWSSRMHVYGFVENHTFLEQFVSMGVPAQFWSNLLAWGYQHNFPIWGYQHIFGALVWCKSFVAFYGLYRDWWFIYAFSPRNLSNDLDPFYVSKIYKRIICSE